MSKAHHSEPLQWHWLYIPLIAFFVFAVGPSVLARSSLYQAYLLTSVQSSAPCSRHPAHVDSNRADFPGPYIRPFLLLYGRARPIVRDPSSEEPGAFETGFMEIHFGPAANLTTILP